MAAVKRELESILHDYKAMSNKKHHISTMIKSLTKKYPQHRFYLHNSLLSCDGYILDYNVEYIAHE